MTVAITAASRCASGFSAGIGRSSITTNTIGARTAPTSFRPRSKRSSPSLSFSTAVGGPA
jgi:hypothetical protein